MSPLKLEKDTIVRRVNGIQAELAELQKLGEQQFEEFSSGDGYKLAEYHLHHALEGVFHISAHILSRIPGGQVAEYKEMAKKLGEFHLIDKNFAETKLVQMAKYRNRIVHFYAEIKPEELYDIIHKDIGDFDVFLSAVKRILENPQQFDFEIE